MNKLIFLIFLFCFTNCSDENNPSLSRDSHQKKLCIITKILTIKSSTFMEQFSAGSALGLYITSEKADRLPNGICKFKNVKIVALNSKKNGIIWKQSSSIYLKDNEPLRVYAYHPYQENLSCPATHIPIQVSPIAILTHDYMYGTHTKGHKAVNVHCPYALLSMKHALSLLFFQIRMDKNYKSEILDSYQLSAIQVGNKAGGSILCNKGTLDITSGQINYGSHPSTASTRLNMDTSVTLNCDSYKTFKIMVMPTIHPTVKEGDIEVIFIINGKSYKYRLPKQTQWDKGYQYLYSFRFDGKNIKLEKYNRKSWISGNNRDFFLP
ncbi:fimbrillin family protein [Parabacteroides bouchesdurhonensis]|uniref:fimbrillin family protein n=1 Tax=Parabacteroides bouchesdurhonensis TaxID=1936995 RepID=UPI000C823C3B|nr:fimbrillin family protein [Parabacteroides bouchesdurhonensis]